MFGVVADLGKRFMTLMVEVKGEFRERAAYELDTGATLEQKQALFKAYLKRKFVTHGVLVVHEQPLYTFVDLPVDLGHEHIEGVLKTNAQTYFPVDMTYYTIDYVVVATHPQLVVLVYLVKNEDLAPYVALFKALRIQLRQIELFQNLLVQEILAQQTVADPPVLCAIGHKEQVQLYLLGGGQIKELWVWETGYLGQLLAPYLMDEEGLKRCYIPHDLPEVYVQEAKAYKLEMVKIKPHYEALMKGKRMNEKKK